VLVSGPAIPGANGAGGLRTCVQRTSQRRHESAGEPQLLLHALPVGHPGVPGAALRLRAQLQPRWRLLPLRLLCVGQARFPGRHGRRVRAGGQAAADAALLFCRHARLSRAIIFEKGTSLTFLEMKDGTV